MDKLHIIYIDDQREVLATLEKELEVFESHCMLEECESAKEAIEVINEIDSQGDKVAVIISDHVMPDKSGVELLSEIQNDGRFEKTKKILLTGQATHADTIQAINNAGINQYFEKPWEADQLIVSVKKLLTEYVMEMGINHAKYSPILDSGTVLKFLQKTT